MPKIRVVAVDDQPFILREIAHELKDTQDIMLVGTASGGAGLPKLVKDSQADVVVLDLAMPNFDPVLAVRQLRAMCPATQVFVLTGLPQEFWVRDLDAAGALGYMLKDDEDPLMLAKGIRAVYARERYWSPAATNKYLDIKDASAQVSDAERMLLTPAERGYSNKRIARELCLSDKTVRKNFCILYQKLDIREDEERNPRMLAVNKAIQLGLIACSCGCQSRHDSGEREQKEIGQASVSSDQSCPPDCKLPLTPTRPDFQPPFLS